MRASSSPLSRRRRPTPFLRVMRSHPLGRDAALIGHVVADDNHFVQMTTSFGGGRIVDWLSGEQLPRIC